MWVTPKETTDTWCTHPTHARWWQLNIRLSRSPSWAPCLTTETPDLLDEGSEQLGIWHPDDGHQDDGNKEEQGTSTAIREELYDAEIVNTQKATLRRDASDVEEASLDEKSTATRGSLRESESLEDSGIEKFPQS